jgi:hypothetical protein
MSLASVTRSLFIALFPWVSSSAPGSSRERVETLIAASQLVKSSRELIRGHSSRLTCTLFDDARAFSVAGHARKLVDQGKTLPRHILRRLEKATRSLDAECFPLYLVLLAHDAYHLFRGTPLNGYAFLQYAAVLTVVAFEFITLGSVAAVAVRRGGVKALLYLIFLLLPRWLFRKLLLLSVPLGAIFCIGEFRGYLLLLAGAVPAPYPRAPQPGK